MRLLVIVALMLGGCSKPQGDSSFQEALRTVVRDPKTTQFLDVAKNAKAICGQFNTKNANGAYGGYLVFVYDRAHDILLVEQEDQAFEAKEKLEAGLDLCANRNDLMRIWISHRVGRG